MTRKKTAAAKDNVVADNCVVADVRMRCQEIMRADDGVFRQRVRAIHRDVFAKNVVIADAELGRFALYFTSTGASPMTQPA